MARASHAAAIGAPVRTPLACAHLLAWGWREAVWGPGWALTWEDPVPAVYPGMVQMPSYQPAMMPAPMPMMPAMGPVPGKIGLWPPGPFWGRGGVGGGRQAGTGGGKVPPGGHSGQGAGSSATALTHPACLPARHAPSHGGTTTATAHASQRGREAAGGPAAGLHQPAGADPGEGRRGPRITSWVPACGERQGRLSSDAPCPVHQAQQMTTQAMTLSLEQQAKQLQKQSQALALAPASTPTSAPAPAQAPAPAPAPRAVSPTSPPPAITHKPKKTPAPRKEPESGLELVGARLRVRGQGWGDGRAHGQLASGLQTWEMWGLGDGATGRHRRDAARPRPRGSK